MILDKTATALYTTLNGSSTLTALLPKSTSIFDSQASDGAELPYVVFSHQAGGPENVDANDLEQNIWYVRAYSDESAKKAAEIFEKVDNLLNRVNISIIGFNTFWCAREQNVTLLENTPNGKIWNAGGLYKIRTG